MGDAYMSFAGQRCAKEISYGKSSRDGTAQETPHAAEAVCQ